MEVESRVLGDLMQLRELRGKCAPDSKLKKRVGIGIIDRSERQRMTENGNLAILAPGCFNLRQPFWALAVPR